MYRNATVIVIIFFSACQSGKETSGKKLTEPVAPLFEATLKPFYHGVASGDPLPDRVIIWTRITPEDSVSNIPVEWEVSENENFDPLLKSDTASTSPLRDYTVKIDVTGLAPGTSYFYRFKALDKTSSVGRTKTTPSGPSDSLKFAVVSCANWEFGYFNAYDRVAEKDVDAVLHLGDYIYEYETGRYGNKNVDRKNLPPHEIVSLQDYRTRYSQYHLDAGLRNVRQRHPFITVWDDHEIANDAYSTGAQNHQADKEGDYAKRKAVAKQAYYEWIPIRESDKHYRVFSYGTLADLIMLDERLEGRTKQMDSVTHPSMNAPDRSMLGEEQLQWFENNLKTSPAAWKVIGNQVIFSDLDMSNVNPKRPRSLDSWDGYPNEKKRIADFVRQNNVQNIVFLAGDTHASWAFEAAVDVPHTYKPRNSQGAFAVEFGTTSVSSSNSNESYSDSVVLLREAQLMKGNPHLKYTNNRDHGYLLLTLYPGKAKAEWFYVETLLRPDKGEHLGKRLEVERDRHTLR